jgi:hypothetical protein
MDPLDNNIGGASVTAIQDYMNARVEKLSLLIDDQLQELGGDQKLDYVALNRAVASAAMRLASTANPSTPTSPSAMQR